MSFYGGVPLLIVPDSARTGVTRACRYDPALNPTYQEIAMHYGVGVVPARPYKPRDKAKDESSVLLAERWIIAALRHRRFHDLAELNQAIRELLVRINDRPFRKREGSRPSVFAAVDRPALRALPAERFDLSQWSRARVNIDYQLSFDGSVYSVPYTLTDELVEVQSTAMTVEVFHKSQRVARPHAGPDGDNPEHRPKSHQAHAEWTPSRMVRWAGSIGPFTAQLFERILADKLHPEMGYRGCLSIIRLATQYSVQRMEAAAERALLTGACRYQGVKSILKNALDQQPLGISVMSPKPAVAAR